MVEYCTINTTTRNLNWPTQPDVLAFSRNTWDCFYYWHCSANPMVLTSVSSYFNALASRAFVKNRGNALATSNTKGLGQTSWIRSVPSALLRSKFCAQCFCGWKSSGGWHSSDWRIVTNSELSRDSGCLGSRNDTSSA